MGFRIGVFDIIPHRAIMKRGFRDGGRSANGRGPAFKASGASLPHRIVCAMWLTGFDVECLSTPLPRQADEGTHLMQAIARANRRYPGDFGLIVDCKLGMLKSLREALTAIRAG